MNNTASMNPTAEEIAKIDAEIATIFAAMDRIDARIAKDQAETVRIRTETRKIIEQLKVR